MYVSPSIENSKQNTSPLSVTGALPVLLDELSVELFSLLSETIVELLSVCEDETVPVDVCVVVEEVELSAVELPEKIPALSELLQPVKIAVSISIAENAEKPLYFINFLQIIDYYI